MKMRRRVVSPIQGNPYSKETRNFRHTDIVALANTFGKKNTIQSILSLSPQKDPRQREENQLQ